MRSLRMRMLAGLIGLLVIGLLGFSVGVETLLERHLLDQVRQQVVTMAGTTAEEMRLGGEFKRNYARGLRSATEPEDLRDPTAIYPPGLTSEVRNADGVVLSRHWLRPEGGFSPARFPAAVTPGLRTIGMGEGTYEMSVTRLETSGRMFTLLLAIPLRGVGKILTTLRVIEIGLGLIILAGGGTLALVLARYTTKPLERIARTADVIAVGDLTHRVPHPDPGSEVGRVGLAFNAMLTRIERDMSRLVESEQRMRRFLAEASHELATPLTSIRGYAELFGAGARDRPADLETAMNRIERESARMGELVDDLLLLAALDEGRPLRGGRVDLRAIAADAVDDARVRFPGRSIELDAEDAVPVRGDEDRLRQVAANLVTNACRHTPAAARVTVRTRTAGDRAVFEVADDGPGLAAEDADRVFERFYRAGSRGSDRIEGGQGNGLGLAIVAAIAAAHGGRAGLTTSPGNGAVFRVELPATSVARSASTPAARNRSAELDPR